MEASHTDSPASEPECCSQIEFYEMSVSTSYLDLFFIMPLRRSGPAERFSSTGEPGVFTLADATTLELSQDIYSRVN